MKTVRIGTRGSLLALAQSAEVARALRRRHPKLQFEIVKIKTTGDEFKSVHLFKKNGIGIFTKKIEKRLLEGRVDIAIHSMKDLPTKLARGLALAAVPKRAKVSDALISRGRHSLETLPAGSRVGTGSPRRKRQLARLRPDLKLVDLRGNLDTRVSKVLDDRTLDGVVVACAGLERLKKFSRYWKEISAELFLPAAGQGALALQVRKNDPTSRRIAAVLNHKESERLAGAEREFLARLGGGCRVPVGILSKKIGSRVRLKAAVFSVNTGSFIEATIERPWRQAVKAAHLLADGLLKQGARRFLLEARAL